MSEFTDPEAAGPDMAFIQVGMHVYYAGPDDAAAQVARGYGLATEAACRSDAHDRNGNSGRAQMLDTSQSGFFSCLQRSTWRETT